MLSLAVIAVTPGMHSYWQRQQLNRVAWDIVSLLQWAQTLAQTQQRSVVICASQDGKQCGGQWSQGMLVFYGHDQQITEPAMILRFHAYANIPVNIDWRGFWSHEYIRFDGYGLGQTLSGRFRLTQAAGSLSRCLVMNRIGRIRVEAECSNL